MSFIQSIIPLLPSSTRAVSQIASGVASRNLADASAARLEAIGAQEGRLRSIQAARLLGTIQASFGGRGVAGGEGTAADIEREAAIHEETDVKRAEFRFTSLADQVRRGGEARLSQGLIGGISSFLDVGRGLGLEARIKALEKQGKALKTTLGVPTILNPNPKTLLGRHGSAVSTIPTPGRTGDKLLLPGPTMVA